MNLEIDIENIEGSFDRIANQLLSEFALRINNIIIQVTEIEFYYFKEGVHEDKYTHPHQRNSGEWRLHKQGLDITLDGTNLEQDGGILIRGIKIGETYINGPLKSLSRVLEFFGPVTSSATIQLVKLHLDRKPIIKTFRHLPNKVQYPEFHNLKYRYLIDFEHLKVEQKEKDKIRLNHVVI